MKAIRPILSLGIIFSFIVGCSVYMAANQPDRKNVNVLDKGTPRSHVIAELGKPLYSKNEAGKICDVFSFVQGYGKGANAGRALFHGAADVLTLGLWEVVGTPVEAIADGNAVQVEVYYDSYDCVEFIKVIEGSKQLKKVNSVVRSNEIQKPSNEQQTSTDDRGSEIEMGKSIFEPESVPENGRTKLAVFPFNFQTGNLKYVSSVKETTIHALSQALNESKNFITTHSYYDIGNPSKIKPIKYSIIPTGNADDLWIKTTFSPKSPNTAIVCEIGKQLGADVALMASINSAGSYTIEAEYYLINIKTRKIYKKGDRFNTSRFSNEIYSFNKLCFGSYRYREQ